MVAAPAPTLAVLGHVAGAPEAGLVQMLSDVHARVWILIAVLAHIKASLQVVIDDVDELLLEFPDVVVSLNLLCFCVLVLLYEFVDTHVATADADEHLTVLFDLDVDALGTVLVDTLRLTKEKDLDSLALGVLVDRLSKCLINFVVLLRNIDIAYRLVILMNAILHSRHLLELRIIQP